MLIVDSELLLRVEGLALRAVGELISLGVYVFMRGLIG